MLGNLRQDANQTGTIDGSELIEAARTLAQQTHKIHNLKIVIVSIVVLFIVAAAAVFGLNMAANEASKELVVGSPIERSAFSDVRTADGESVAVAALQKSYALHDVNTLSLSTLGGIKEILVPTQAGTRSYRVDSVVRNGLSTEIRTTSGDVVVISGLGSEASGWVLQKPHSVVPDQGIGPQCDDIGCRAEILLHHSYATEACSRCLFCNPVLFIERLFRLSQWMH